MKDKLKEALNCLVNGMKFIWAKLSPYLKYYWVQLSLCWNYILKKLVPCLKNVGEQLFPWFKYIAVQLFLCLKCVLKAIVLCLKFILKIIDHCLSYILSTIDRCLKYIFRRRKAYEIRQYLLLLCEFIVIALCLDVMYYYVPLWTITIVAAFFGFFVLFFLVKVFRIFLGLIGLFGREKLPLARETIKSFHFKNAWIGYYYYVMLLLLSVTCSIVTYCTIVDHQYHKIYEAYLHANVIQDSLKSNASFPDEYFQQGHQSDENISYKRALIELMREMKLLSADEYYLPDANNNPDMSKLGDHPLAVCKILEISQMQNIRPIQNKMSTISYLIEFNKKLPTKKQKTSAEKLKVLPYALAAIFAQQPGIYQKTSDLFTPQSDEIMAVPATQPFESSVKEWANKATHYLKSFIQYLKSYFKSKSKDTKSKDAVPADQEAMNKPADTNGANVNVETSKQEIQSSENIMAGYGTEYSIRNEETRWQYLGIMDWFFKPEPITDELTLRLIYTSLKLYEEGFINMIVASEKEGELNRQDYYFIRSWCANLISKLHDNSEVKKQKTLLSVIHGPEQFGMLIVFFLSFYMMIGRLFMLCWNRIVFFTYPIMKRKTRFTVLQKTDMTPEEQQQLADRMRSKRELLIDELYPSLLNTYNAEGKDQETKNKDMIDLIDYTTSYLNSMESRSRWLINWSAAALPSIGFIGTVRGLLLALGDADSIVRATSALGQAAAITSVATQLSLAFTTTLVALLLGLIISLLNYWQVKAERNYLSLMDILLRNHFNVWGQVNKPRKGA